MIKGISISQGGPRISHFFFADDNIVFCKAINANCAELQQLLSVYANASGQVVNIEKTTIFFSYNTSQTCRDSICSILGTNPNKQFEKYLGLTPVVGRAKRKAFNEIKDRVWWRLQGWKEKLLSQAGREILIKAVIQAILTYAMSCFKFLFGLCADISAMATRFWWGQRGNERKIHWLSRHRLNQLRSRGVLGFVIFNCSIKPY